MHVLTIHCNAMDRLNGVVPRLPFWMIRSATPWRSIVWPICISKPSSVSLRGMAITPALLMSTSKRSQRWLSSSAQLRTEFKDARSNVTASISAVLLSALIWSHAVCALFWSRHARITRAPLSASAFAASKPIPLLPPVITTVRPS